MMQVDNTGTREFEQAAQAERAYYAGLSIEDLHTLIANREFGRTGMVWQALRERTTLVTSVWVLLDLLEHQTINRSARAQAAGVLLELADAHDWSAESLADDDDPGFDARLTDFRRFVMERVRVLTR